MKKYLFAFCALLIMVASCSKKSNPTKEKAINAAMLFSNNCARCHGADGMTGRAPNLSKITIDKNTVAQIITNGKGHMPGFEDQLSKPEIAALADWVLALKK
ncbi:MAG TPA: cytochrome c [Chitinophagales bacterium]|nr:cytochrome c [Chitinophagales bacterium]